MLNAAHRRSDIASIAEYWAGHYLLLGFYFIDSFTGRKHICFLDFRRPRYFRPWLSRRYFIADATFDTFCSLQFRSLSLIFIFLSVIFWRARGLASLFFSDIAELNFTFITPCFARQVKVSAIIFMIDIFCFARVVISQALSRYIYIAIDGLMFSPLCISPIFACKDTFSAIVLFLLAQHIAFLAHNTHFISPELAADYYSWFLYSDYSFKLSPFILSFNAAPIYFYRRE